MCGIIGYIGNREAFPIILRGLKHLEYRGYDSAGIASIYKGKIHIRRCAGKIADLENIISQKPLVGKIALGHTRWATHGKPSQENAHPHTDCKKELVIVHNGIIENYLSLKDSLIQEGHIFSSETDSEVVAHLIEKYLDGNLEAAVRTALEKVKGSYAIGAIWKKDEGSIVAARSGSPLVIGLKNGESFIASDIPAILGETRDIVYLGNGEIATIGHKEVKIKTVTGYPGIERQQKRGDIRTLC
jgi:glucosamine--fructose-6-phosphate aminotransferase (isomerizing)